MTDLDLTDHQKTEIRRQLILTAYELIGIPYRYEAEWTDYAKRPEALDCSELVEGVYRINGLKMPDGTWNQFSFTLPSVTVQDGDIAFFGKGGSISKIYHSGIVFGDSVIEARAYDEKAGFETNKVIIRPLQKWQDYRNFCGIRSHSKLV